MPFVIMVLNWYSLVTGILKMEYEKSVKMFSLILMDYLMSLLLLSPCLHFWLDGQRRSFLVPNYSPSKS